MYGRVISTPLGPVTVILEDRAIVSLRFGYMEIKDAGSALMDLVEKEINQYFSGKRRSFSIPINPSGTDYQKKVWKTIMEIPYGELRTYEWVAEKAGGSPRSVGNALGANPIPIIIPCHRIIRKDGSLGGYSSGIEIKRFLIEHERLHSYESVLK